MNVSSALTGVSYAMVAMGFLPVAMSGEIGLASPIAFVVAGALSLLRDSRSATPPAWRAKAWTAALVVAFFGVIATSIQDSNWLLHALQFALLLTISRFFQRRFAKDFLQLLALSFVLLLIGAIVSPGPLFAGAFLVYTVLTMWGLTLLHLTREMEIQTRTGPEHLTPDPPDKRRWFGLRAPLPPAPPDPWPNPVSSDQMLDWRSRRLLTKRFLAALSGLALFVLVGSALFFFLFPRLGIGFFFAQTRGNHAVTGFGTDAQLGNFGQIKTNAEVVARVMFPKDPERLQHPVRLRGTSFESFVGNGWTRPQDSARDLLMDMEGRYMLPWAGQVDPTTERTCEAEVFLEPLGQDTKVLFAPPRTKTVQILDARFDVYRGRTRRVARTATGDLTYRLSSAFTKAPPDMALHYAVEVIESRDEVKDDARLDAAEGEPNEGFAQRWTAVPQDLDPRIATLAKSLAGAGATRYRKVLNIENGLRAGWKYSLAGDQDNDKPLTDFLFTKKYGHCEYFATAMTLMVRSLGIPARVVHGFSGGVYNGFGNYRMIREADAHSWVEVFFVDVGWRTFDPTPPGGQVAPEDEGVGAWLRQAADGASMLWYQWVVEYDLERQVGLVKDMAKFLPGNVKGGIGGLGDPTTRAGRQFNKAQIQRLLAAGAALAAVAGLAYALWWTRRRRLAAHVWDARLDRATRGLQRALEKAGLERAAWETWHVVSARVRAADAEVGAAVASFAVAYDEARYAPTHDAGARQTARARAIAAAKQAKKLPKVPK